MDKETAIKELSAMTKKQFNEWFDTTLPPRAQFVAITGTEAMIAICAEWYIKQQATSS